MTAREEMNQILLQIEWRLWNAAEDQKAETKVLGRAILAHVNRSGAQIVRRARERAMR